MVAAGVRRIQALINSSMKPPNGKVIANWGNKSGIGLPHSTTLARSIAPRFFREVVECGSPMPL
jgi:hypothetical protein